MTKQKAIETLKQYDGHDIVSGNIAVELAQAFGLTVKPYTIQAGSGLKDAHFNSGKQSEDNVYAMLDLVQDICQHLKLSYPSFSGRGSQYRACIDTIAKS